MIRWERQMQTLRMKCRVNEDRKLSFTLPSDIPVGTVEVIVVVDNPESDTSGADDTLFDELMAFHKGRRLNGLTIKELALEGRR